MTLLAYAIEGEAEFVEKEIKAMRQAVREVVKISPPPEPEEGKADFVIMPIPISTPTVGTGLGAVSMFLYKAGVKAVKFGRSGQKPPKSNSISCI